MEFEIVHSAEGKGEGEVLPEEKDPRPPKADHSQVSKRNRGPYIQGHKVKVRLPHVLTGLSPFSKPMRIIQTLGNWTYKLSDGQVWNARRLRWVYDEPTQTPRYVDEVGEPRHKNCLDAQHDRTKVYHLCGILQAHQAETEDIKF